MADSKKSKPIDELRGLDSNALTQKIAELKKQLVEQQRANAANELPNPKAITATRRQIARAETVRAQVQGDAATAAKEEEK